MQLYGRSPIGELCKFLCLVVDYLRVSSLSLHLTLFLGIGLIPSRLVCLNIENTKYED